MRVHNWRETESYLSLQLKGIIVSSSVRSNLNIIDYSDRHRYVTCCHKCANPRFIGCRTKGFFCSLVDKIEISKRLLVNSKYRYNEFRNVKL